MSNCKMPQGHPTHCGCEPDPLAVQTVSSVWLSQIRNELLMYADRCYQLTGEVNDLKAQVNLLDTQHELALLHDHYKLYPEAWCCDAARWSNGWNHATNCKNWVLKF